MKVTSILFFLLATQMAGSAQGCELETRSMHFWHIQLYNKHQRPVNLYGLTDSLPSRNSIKDVKSVTDFYSRVYQDFYYSPDPTAGTKVFASECNLPVEPEDSSYLLFLGMLGDNKHNKVIKFDSKHYAVIKTIKIEGIFIKTSTTDKRIPAVSHITDWRDSAQRQSVYILKNIRRSTYVSL